ncbi:hypothetical protein DSO57_1015483 [Entomophthora muscae]|uniref:Uncharacterized protein n=1 Tax=Entomophthora muscae TaxID=34485 RepID=A0ACC2TG18_9FUNG|nr:hypothetical protein DSO57_1015483 [Entomophthora muscae]
MRKSLVHFEFVAHPVPAAKASGPRKACDQCRKGKVVCNGTCFKLQPQGRKRRTRNIFSGVKVDFRSSSRKTPPSPFTILDFSSGSNIRASVPSRPFTILDFSSGSISRDSVASSLPEKLPLHPIPYLPVYDYTLPDFKDLAKYSLSHNPAQ